MAFKTKDSPISHISAQKRLWYALALGALYIIIVFAGGLLSGSLTLLADSAHMLGHNLALAIAIGASITAQKLSADQYSVGHQRIETIGGYTNGLLLIVIGLSIGYEAIGRFYVEHHEELHHHHEIDTSLMGGVALVGLLLHGLSAWILYGGRKESLNIYALYLHLFFDVAATLTGLLTSVLIHVTGKDVLDSVASMVIAALIVFSAVKMVRKSLRLLAGMGAETIDVKKVKTAVCALPHVTDMHDILVQPTRAGGYALSAHLVVSQDCVDTDHWQKCRQEAEKLLADKFDIRTTVLQIENA